MRALTISILSLVALAGTLTLLQGTCQTSAIAEGEKTETKAPETSESSTEPKTKTLVGGVKMIELVLQDVREVALAIKRVRHSAENLYDEVTQEPISYQSAPNLVGSTVLNMQVAAVNGSGYLAPRRKWMDHSINEMKPCIAMMKEEIDEVIAGRDEPRLPSDARDSIKESVEDWIKNVQELNDEFVRLEPLTKKFPYDNGGIAKITSEMHETTNKMEKVRRAIYKQLQADAAAEAKKGA